LPRIWFLGDVHGHFEHLACALTHSSEPPRWLVFLGDLDVAKPLWEQLILEGPAGW
jgi:hypothetical protein